MGRLQIVTGNHQALIDHSVAQLCAQWPEGVSLERLELPGQKPALLEALGAPSLFGGGRHLVVSGLEQLTADERDRVKTLLADSDCEVIATASGLTPAGKKAWGQHPAVALVDASPDKDGRWVERLAADHGLKLSAAARAELRSFQSVPERIANVLRQLSCGGVTEPTPAQVRRLLGEHLDEHTAWEISDLIESGRGAEAAERARSSIPLALLGYLNKRAGHLAQLTARPAADAGEVAERLAVSPAAARSLLTASRRLQVDQATTILRVLAAADAEAKEGDPQVAVARAVTRVAALHRSARTTARVG